MDLSLFPANYDGYSVLIMILISRLYHCVVGSVWTCDQCGYAFNNAYELLMHMITDENCSSLSEKQKRHHLKLIPFNAKLAILGAVDWEGYGNQIEAFVDALEVRTKIQFPLRDERF